MSRLSDPAIRRRLELNPLTTALGVGPPQQQQHPNYTPLSAVSATSLSAQFAYQPAAYTPLSAVRQYNPQQWTPSPSVLSPDHGYAPLPFPPARPHDPEVVIPAPPPYSPPRSQPNSQQPAAEIDTSFVASPVARGSPIHGYRSSPEPAANATFQTPPPPPTRRPLTERPQTFYGTTSFSSRNAPEVPYLSPGIIRDQTPAVPPIRPLQHGEYQGPDVESHPPASRRAASAGAISTPSSSQSRASSTSRWEPGMRLPPPPPGLPPSSRSQSMNRPSNQIVSPPTRRPAATMASSLGPVPPTPAGWVDEDIQIAKSPNRGLVIDTSSISVDSSSAAQESNSGSSSSGLSRHHAIKGDGRSIRERRSESKSGKRVVSVEEVSNNPWVEALTPSDTVVPPLTILGRRPTITKSTPRSARLSSYQSDPPQSGASQSAAPQSAGMSSHGTPSATPASVRDSSKGSTPRAPAPTPPFSPHPNRSTFATTSSSTIPPKALPTPPPQSKLALGSPARPVPLSLNMTYHDSRGAVAPLNISRPASRQSMSDQLPVPAAEHFCRTAIERHQAFAQKEAAAATDEERVRIFAEFIVTESRLRRIRYASAIDAMGSEILELTRDLFRPYNSSRRESTVSRNSGWTPESSAGPGSRSHRSSMISSAQLDNPQLQSHSEPNSATGPLSPALPDTTYWNNYKPSLSPIPSINTHSMSEALDGSDSRGRPSSRWWEVSDGGSIGNSSGRLERSKRESKYMGMPKELREKLQFDDTAIATANAVAGPSNLLALGPNEYPAEKVGDPTSPPLSGTLARSPAPFTPQPFTPNPAYLDVSRLVTLPPPYPRHHPAVNNNHPDLTSIRITVRALSDFTEVEATKSRFIKDSTRLRSEAVTAKSQRRNSLRARISREIETGNMTFADAAECEKNAEASEADKAKEASKAEFMMFQEQVVGPLNSLLMERVDRATSLFEQLKSQLSVEAQQNDPNSTQEEGDEQPELLEKLTLLKWIFEARELLHREVYDVLSDRNDRYRDMVITPYKLSGNTAKVESSMKFFAADGLQRKLQDEQEILKRTEDFMDVIEKNVRDGVEVLLNAFWDIAPDLSRITEKIPAQLYGFQIQIPAAEYDENPSYFDYPMQYLYSLLGHAEKSTYQFIESQTNLLCLLHEVKSGVTVANCRLMRTQRVAQGEAEDEVERELRDVEKDEEGRLTDDLKEKVRCVEELWSSGLGTELKGVKERLVRYLVEQGGWVEDD